MKVYDYSDLLKTARNINESKLIAESKRLDSKKEELSRLEAELISSGLLDDWNELKKLCRELNISLSLYYHPNALNKCVLNYLHDGMCSYDNRGSLFNGVCFYYSHSIIMWKRYFSGSGNTCPFERNDEKAIDLKISLIKGFMETYEDYRDYLMKKVFAKMESITNETNTILKEVNA